MGPGSRQETIEDHIGDWNWSKIIALGVYLYNRSRRALREQNEQQEALAIFSTNQLSWIPEWKALVEEFEAGRSTFNPYALPNNGASLPDIRLELLREEQAKERAVGTDDPIVQDEHSDQSPTDYIFMLLDLEDTQRQLRQDIQENSTPTSQELADFTERRMRLQRSINRLRIIQATYLPCGPQYLTSVLPSAANEEPLEPELIPLLPPSALPLEIRSSSSRFNQLVQIELRVRDAQCRKFLGELRHTLICKQRLLTYKNQHARHQAATTRSRGLINRQQSRVAYYRDSYRHAWQCKFRLCGGDEEAVGWQKLGDQDVRPLVDLDEALKKLSKSKMYKGARMTEKVSETRGTALIGEKSRVLSWIWYAAEPGDGFSTEKALHEGLRVEWCKAYARVRRWNEEVQLIQEEQRRCLETLEWQAKWWEQRANVPQFLGSHAEGVAAYANYQANIKQKIASAFAEQWKLLQVSGENVETGSDIAIGESRVEEEEGELPGEVDCLMSH
ncbi:hypothetical protein EV361DRAFT_813085 [Lentinula raphanica]|nr:hypothetical protein EV361DRAFT_813085 [Lentinula raphanica]